MATVLGARRTVLLAAGLYAAAGLLLLATDPPGPLAALLAVPYVVNTLRFRRITDTTSGAAHRGWQLFLPLNYVTGFLVTLLLIGWALTRGRRHDLPAGPAGCHRLHAAGGPALRAVPVASPAPGAAGAGRRGGLLRRLGPVGIAEGVFLHRQSPYMTGGDARPQLPLEEGFFLLFLSQITMVLFTGALRLLRGRGRDGRAATPADPTDGGAGDLPRPRPRLRGLRPGRARGRRPRRPRARRAPAGRGGHPGGPRVLTAVFDNVMIAAGLFDYGHELLLGVYVGQAPVEDFAYPLGSALLLPALWLLLTSRPRAGRRGRRPGRRPHPGDR